MRAQHPTIDNNNTSSTPRQLSYDEDGRWEVFEEGFSRGRLRDKEDAEAVCRGCWAYSWIHDHSKEDGDMRS